MAGFERCHFARRDLDWLPASLRVLRWMVTGSIVGVTALGLAMVAAFLDELPLAVGLFFLAAGAAATLLGDWLARAAIARRLRRMQLGRRRDQTLARVRGKVVPREPVAALLDEGRGVYRRLLVDLDGLKLVHETGRDFLLADGEGSALLVRVDGARLVDPDDRVGEIPGSGEIADRVLALPWPDELDGALRRRGKVRDEDGTLRHQPAVLEGFAPAPILVAETLVATGDEIEVVGLSDSAVDAGGADRGLREPPIRAVLRAGAGVPLLISRR